VKQACQQLTRKRKALDHQATGWYAPYSVTPAVARSSSSRPPANCERGPASVRIVTPDLRIEQQAVAGVGAPRKTGVMVEGNRGVGFVGDGGGEDFINCGLW